MNKSRLMQTQNNRLLAYLLLVLVMLVLFAGMSLLSRTNPLDYYYNTYQLQAQAWLRGETALDKNYEYLELAVYQGK